MPHPTNQAVFQILPRFRRTVTIKAERNVILQADRHAAISSNVLAAAAGRAIRRNVSGMLERDIQIGQDDPIGHQRSDRAHVDRDKHSSRTHAPNDPKSRAKSVICAR